MSAKILVVDRNQAFSTMLQEMLEAEGGYQVQTIQQGSKALNHLRKNDYDLTIVDVDTDSDDVTYDELIRRIRHIRRTMRIMLIPLMGEELPAEARRFDIQGTLSKPFFVDDLLPNIRDALSRQVVLAAATPPPPPPPPPATASPPARKETASGTAVQQVLSDLVRETHADAVLLVSFSGGESNVTAHAGPLGAAQVKTLAHLSVNTIQTARAAANLLGQTDAPFEHNIFENDTLRLYIVTLSRDRLLIVVAPGSTPLGTIRHNLRRARRNLATRTLT